MIGVIAQAEERELVREFFELFKTPWEFYRPEERYDVVLCAREDASIVGVAAALVVVYAGQETPCDREEKIGVEDRCNGGMLLYKGEPVPIYWGVLTFLDDSEGFLIEEQSRKPVGVRRRSGDTNVARIGYDLFRELGALLTDGQPVEHASIPTVEMHIALLRDLIVESGIPLVEIPPVPEGYAFIACLTHDVDHPSIRRHRWDRTAWGFLYRALIGSVLDVLRGRVSVRHLMINWAAASKLPFVYLGFARDFWLDFDRYLSIEGNAGSTFFVLPFKGQPGRIETGSAPRIRASEYGPEDIADQLHTVVKGRGEIGLHGIDAWVDSASGQEEKTRIEKVTGTQVAGVRMHWLYFNSESPARLEKAGFTYDSTVGYNETVGYRAGTTQVYKPVNASHLLELPMHVMDTALFYPVHLGLSSAEAAQRVDTLIENAVTWGGVLTFNWHDRSIAPERLWGEFYAGIVDELREKGGWCTSAGRAVIWFQMRRSIVFHGVDQGIELRLSDAAICTDAGFPALKVRVYNPHGPAKHITTLYVDTTLTWNQTCVVPAAASRTRL